MLFRTNSTVKAKYNLSTPTVTLKLAASNGYFILTATSNKAMVKALRVEGEFSYTWNNSNTSNGVIPDTKVTIAAGATEGTILIGNTPTSGATVTNIRITNASVTSGDSGLTLKY